MLRGRRGVHLKRALDNLYAQYDAGYLRTDPLWFPKQYESPEDREVAAFFAAQFAYGNVPQIFRSLRELFRHLGPHPAAFVRSYRGGRAALDGFTHRFNGPADLDLLLRTTAAVLRKHGSLQTLFSSDYRAGRLREAISAFSRRFLEISAAFDSQTARSFAFLFPDPVAGGSACKRLNMFLRWMVRRDHLDLGLWTCMPASELVIPLDTHVGRISRYIGLTSRQTDNWKTAEDITSALRALDPEDPVKYDFAIARLGILRLCPRKRIPVRCRECSLFEVCLL
ncbi:MAG: TIGR02757 family protein [Acidobacteria bacterium]|nr:TIGR02757 family protein [Acidobacteriota bacterium]